MKSKGKMSHFVYILKNTEDKLYIGCSKDPTDRLKRHNSKRGAYFVSQHKNFELVYLEEYPTQLEAMRREKQLKGWRRDKKEALIANDLARLKRL